jgi:Iodothyronine deiodinase
MNEGPGLEQSAPDFTLKMLNGKETVRLSDRIGKQPIVLVFGNFTCGPFRNAYALVDEVAAKHKDEVTFLGVYVREAHPIDGWRMSSNDEVEIAIPQPKKFEERLGIANTCNAKLKMSIPLLVDEIDDRVGHAYSGMPSRLYIVDQQGKIAYKSGRGPFGFKVGEMEQSLLMLLMDK